MTKEEIKAYLRRIGISEVQPPTKEYLFSLHQAHVRTLTWQTVDIFARKPTSIGFEQSVQLVLYGRSGYCFHLNGAFSALLHSLGYHVNLHRAGVQPLGAEPRVNSFHLGLSVNFRDDLYAEVRCGNEKTLEKYPEIKQATTAPNGNIYSLSSIDRNPHTMLQQKMWINTEWLKKLNLEMPTTTDEFEKVLQAFKEKDPNGNGKADEIPMIGGIQEKLTGLDSFLMNSFILNDLNADQLIFDDKGSIEVNFNKPGFKKGLQYLNKLYAQGLIAPESFTQNNDQMKSLLENGDARVGVISSFIPQVFSNITGKRWLDYKTVPPLKGPDGLQQTPYRYYSVNGGNLLITNAAKNPEVAFRWADALYNYDISMSGNIGTEGIGWRKPTTDELGLNGKPANWVRLMAAGTLQNNNWGQTTPYHFSREMFEGLAAGPNEVPRVLYEETQKNYEPYKTKQEQSVPPVFFDDAQSSELSDLQKTIKDYVKEMTTRFIIGDASIDKEWDKYIQTLDGMNLKRYLQIYNEGYKAQYKK